MSTKSGKGSSESTAPPKKTMRTPTLPRRARDIVNRHHAAQEAAKDGKKKPAPTKPAAEKPKEPQAPSLLENGKEDHPESAPAAPPSPESAPIRTEVHGEMRRDGSHVVTVERPDAVYVQGDVYRVSCGSEGVAGLRAIKDPTKRFATIAKRMRIRPDIDVPSKEILKEAYDQDMELIWRVVEGVSLVGHRGPTLEETAERGNGKKH